jgi:hypothetical protein
MTTRPRSHQLEDESRRAFASQLPTKWTVQDLAPDYGLDQRVEIFDDHGRATGLAFYVQLKSTDANDNNRNRRIRIRADHYRYWNSLSDPVLLVLYFSQSRVIYVRWAHRFYPDFRPESLRLERQTVSLARSSRWRQTDVAWVVDELINLREVARGAVDLPVTVGVSGSPDKPIKVSSVSRILGELKQLTKRTDIRWRIDDDRSDKFHIYLGEKKVIARAGNVSFSITDLAAGETGDEFPWANAAVCALGMAVTLVGAPAPGMLIISRYCAASPTVLGTWATGHLITAAMRSGHFHPIMDLIEALLADGSEKARKSALHLYASLSVWGVIRLSEMELKRLKEIGRDDAFAAFTPEIASELQLEAAIDFGERGRLRDAIQLIEYLFADPIKRSELPTDVVLRASRWAFELGEYDLGEEWIRGLPTEFLDIEALLLLVRCIAMQGRYADSLVVLHLVADENEQQGRVLLTGLLLVMILAVTNQTNQDRQPDQAVAIKRSLDDKPTLEDVRQAFFDAIAYDAATVETWSLCHIVGLYELFGVELFGIRPGKLNIEKLKPVFNDLVFGPFSAVGTAVLAEVDPEWWALACASLLYRGYIRGVQYCIDFALDVCPESFLELTQNGYPDADSGKFFAMLAGRMLEARRHSSKIVFREAPEFLDTVRMLDPKYKVSYLLIRVGEDGKEGEVQLCGFTHPPEPEDLYLVFQKMGKYLLEHLSNESTEHDDNSVN